MVLITDYLLLDIMKCLFSFLINVQKGLIFKYIPETCQYYDVGEKDILCIQMYIRSH